MLHDFMINANYIAKLFCTMLYIRVCIQAYYNLSAKKTIYTVRPRLSESLLSEHHFEF